MTPAEAERIVASLTYKPDWHITIDFGDMGSYVGEGFSIRADYYHALSIVNGVVQERDTIVGSGDRMPLSALEQMEPATLIRLIGDLIRRSELHEWQEWYRFDGLPVSNPHPEWDGQKIAVLP